MFSHIQSWHLGVALGIAIMVVGTWLMVYADELERAVLEDERGHSEYDRLDA